MADEGKPGEQQPNDLLPPEEQTLPDDAIAIFTVEQRASEMVFGYAEGKRNLTLKAGCVRMQRLAVPLAYLSPEERKLLVDIHLRVLTRALQQINSNIIIPIGKGIH